MATRPVEEVPLGVRVFPACEVLWVVRMPTGLARDTIWPDIDWIGALFPAPAKDGEETPAKPSE